MVRVRIVLSILVVLAACQPGQTASPPDQGAASPDPTAGMTTTSTTTPAATTTTTAPPSSTTTTTSTTATAAAEPSSTTTLPSGVSEAPAWLGQRPLPEDEDGDPIAQPTPPELVDRRFATADHLPPPADDSFHSSVEEVPAEVASRSTWSEECPVTLEELAYVNVTFRGFDGLPHTGELLVAESVAEDIVSVFRTLYEAAFPIEEMLITSPADLDAEPTGDGNPTTAFVCRPVTGGTGWSEHARGIAIDINPFHNPYIRGDTVLPELAGAYTDRDRDLPGMIHEGDAVTEAFDRIGWGWGGRWSSLKDYQHFSLSGR